MSATAMVANLSLFPPNHRQFIVIEHDRQGIGQLVGIVHGPLVHVAFHRAQLPGVVAYGDFNPVAASVLPLRQPAKLASLPPARFPLIAIYRQICAFFIRGHSQ